MKIINIEFEDISFNNSYTDEPTIQSHNGGVIVMTNSDVESSYQLVPGKTYKVKITIEEQ